MPAIPPAQHQTAAAIFALHEAREAAEAPRQYLGASVIGHPCARYLWVDRGPSPAKMLDTLA